MEIQLAMEVFQVAMTVDEAGQNGFALDVNHLRVGGNGNFPAPTDGLKPASPDNDDGILHRRPAGAIDQSATLHHEHFVCHLLFSFLVSKNRPMTTVVSLPFTLSRFSLELRTKALSLGHRTPPWAYCPLFRCLSKPG